ncbi:hypothetical protein G6F57_006179 [Rhizopus arrhizus]|uniref:Uncharacterized protein n=1 Tax=Rhizopus oryzae TaxID=64495 RepID=A0A9P7BYF1_RHIOR|nr:hypothetical protein G6F23_007145 [Rhizopus arrhizus]KAG1424694.1 hypothetical protein G6F58_002272 [Rhizopus delemar]KAG0770619.1 hypothetical protein G6F24_000025 [Rhizopus arrhizus]KAG0787731.1 hypothetical protein G6F22_007221 [Rhizopus arrhizus]KAG0790484.1 hypothetical protein G6F21_005777 [Rhizopus arrhizus]
MSNNNQINVDPFVLTPGQDKSLTISADDMLKLLESLKMDSSSSPELRVLYESAKNGETVDQDILMNTVSSLLANDSKHFSELMGSIGTFDIHF